jgi:signal transduction histidine kinase
MFAPRFTRFTQGSPDFLAIHLLMELFAVIVAMLVVVISWHSFDARNAPSTNTLICGFLIVACCDLVYALTYDGMLPLLAPSSSERAIFFWLMGRTFEVLTLGLVAMRWVSPLSRGASLATGILASAGIIWFGTYHLDVFPETFVKGQGVTAFKAVYEFVLCVLNVLVAALLWRRAESTSEPQYYLLALSSFVMGVGEIMFTSYVSPSDFQNIFGHGFKIIAYTALYRATFVVSVRAPYHQLRESQARLAESEERFRALTHLSSDWYWEQDAELRFISTSRRQDIPAGIPFEEQRGRRRWELPGIEPVDQTWGEHRAVLEARQPFRDLILKRTARDGSVHVISVSGEPTFDRHGAFTGYRGVSRAITDAFLADELARASNRRLQLAVENLSESIAIMDADDRIVVANRYFRELNGNTRFVDVGRKYEEHLRAGMALGNYPDSVGREEAWLAERLERRRAGGTTEVRRQDGTWLRVTDQKLPDGGTITFALDVTALKQSELALREANADLERRVAERTAEIEAFMYSVSHDLRAPIRAIDGYSALLQESPDLPNTGEHVDLIARIRANTARMSALLQDLLDLSMYSTKELLKERIDMRAKVDSVIAELHEEAGAATFDIGDLPACHGDRILVRQVWSNLISNALKYSSKSPAQLIRIGFADGAYFVSDNGTGFDMVYAGKLFKLFSRLHHERDFAGTGIGLAIVKRVVERHGGRIRAEGAVGKGATFRFSLPD